VYYGGCGIEAIDPESIVSVRWGDSMPVLMVAKEAKILYDKITVDKAIWGGYMFSELIEAHHFIDPDDKLGEDDLPF
jgi:hypothetical protein